MLTRSDVTIRLTTGLLAGLLLSAAVVPTAYGAETQNPTTQTGRESITLSPVSKNYKVDAGQTFKDKLTIVNDGEVAYNFNVYAKPYSVTGVEYDPDFESERNNTDFDDWVEFEKETYTAAAGETVIVNYTVNVPKSASPGGHYGVLFAETEPTKLTGSTGVERKKRVGAIMYATVNGTFETGSDLLGLNISNLQFKAPIKADITIENTGNSDFAAATTFTVSDLFGSKKHEAKKSYQILPKTSRQIVMEWPQSPGFGLFKVTASADYLDQNASKSAYVLMAPVWAYLVFVVALLGGVIYLVQKRR